MEVQRRHINRQLNLQPTLVQCDADLHLNAPNADWFNVSKESST